MTDYLWLELACNDLHGRCLDRVQNIEISSGAGTEVSLYGSKPLTLRFLGDKVKIGRRQFGCDQRSRYRGNMAWDGVPITPLTARLVVRYLLERGWVVEEAAVTGPLADLAEDHWEARRP